MADLLELSRRFIDEGVPADSTGLGPVNRVNLELSEVTDGVAMVEAFSHVVALDSGDGLVLFDASLGAFGPGVVKSLRGWRTDPVHTLVYTHGHVDHVGGAVRRAGRRRRARHPAARRWSATSWCPSASIATTSPTATTR